MTKRKHLPVMFKAFKAVNVQNPNLHLGVHILPNRSIDFFNKPGKHNRTIKFPHHKYP